MSSAAKRKGGLLAKIRRLFPTQAAVLERLCGGGASQEPDALSAPHSGIQPDSYLPGPDKGAENTGFYRV